MATLRKPLQNRLLSLRPATSCRHFQGISLIRKSFAHRNDAQNRKTLVPQPKANPQNSKPRTGVYARSIVISQIPKDITRSDVLKFFKNQELEVKDVKMRMNRFIFSSHSHCYAELGSEEQANTAVQKLHNAPLNGKPVTVHPMPQDTSLETSTEPYLFLDEGTGARQAVLPLIEGRRTALRVEVPGWGEQPTILERQAHLNNKIIRNTFANFGIETLSNAVPFWGMPKSGEKDRHIAYIDFRTVDDADDAIAYYHGAKVKDRKISLQKPLLEVNKARVLKKIDPKAHAELVDLGLVEPLEKKSLKSTEGKNGIRTWRR